MIKITMESVMAPTMQMRRHRNDNTVQLEHLEKYDLGKRYPDFEILEPFIVEWDVDPEDLEIGDVIIRDWQFGHMKNTGYRPLQVVEVFDGVSVTVQDRRGIKHRICMDPILMKDKKFHKLDSSRVSTNL